jgi:hypothetical protein
MITTTDPRLTTKALIVRHPIRRRSAAPMIGPVKRGLFGRVLAATGVGNVRDVRRGAHAGGVRLRLEIPRVPGVMPVPDVTHPAAKWQFFADHFGFADDCVLGSTNFPQS